MQIQTYMCMCVWVCFFRYGVSASQLMSLSTMLMKLLAAVSFYVLISFNMNRVQSDKMIIQITK